MKGYLPDTNVALFAVSIPEYLSAPVKEAIEKALGLRPLLFRPAHIATLFRLQPIHQDPFDRALTAQAKAEDLTLLTTDGTTLNMLPTDCVWSANPRGAVQPCRYDTVDGRSVCRPNPATAVA